MRNIILRQALPEDVRPALELGHVVFLEFVLPDFEPPASERARNDHINDEQVQLYQSRQEPMFVALDGPRIVGITCSGRTHLRKLYVDPAYHRLGIATALLNTILAAMGAGRVTVNSSRYAAAFYQGYGFVPTDIEQNKDGFVFTPMAYDIP